MDVQSAARRWADTWERAWPAKQSAEIAALYHEAASYRSGPFREAEAGGALAYVERQPEAGGPWRTSSASSPSRRRWNAGLQSPSRRATEPRSSGGPVFIEAGQAITLAGATVLRFDSAGLVVDHVDYWVQSQGRTVPYAGWGEV